MIYMTFGTLDFRAVQNAAASMPIQQVDFEQVDGFAWIEKGIGYTVVGKLPPPELHRIAELVRQQLR